MYYFSGMIYNFTPKMNFIAFFLKILHVDKFVSTGTAFGACDKYEAFSLSFW